MTSPAAGARADAPRAPRLRWWMPLWIGNALCLACTLYAGSRWPGHLIVRPFHLGIESNPATWWSAMQFFMFGLLAHSNALKLRAADRATARAWLILSFVGLALAADELGSIHERAAILVPLPRRYVLLPFALAFGAAMAYSLSRLRRLRSPAERVFKPVAIGVGLFILVYLLEWMEQRVALSGTWKGVRMTIEEGGELAGVAFLLAGVIRTRRSLSAGGGERLAPAGGRRELCWLPERQTLRGFVILAALLALPVTLFRLQFAAGELGLPRRGEFGLAIPILLYAGAALGALRSAWRAERDRKAWLFLAGVLTVLSLDTESYFHRYALGYVSWRYELDLLVGIPLLLAAAVALPALRRPAILGSLTALLALVAISLFLIEKPLASLVVPSVVALAVSGLVLFVSPEG